MRMLEEKNEKRRAVGRMFNNAFTEIHRMESLKYYGSN
jgi:hypothetical protein